VLMEARVENLSYRFLAAGFQAFIWGGEVIGDENLPEQEPALLVSNHLRALGPIAIVSCVPRRLHPWVAADVMDAQRAPDYLRWDFVERELHLRMPFSLWLAKAIAKISVPLLNQTGCIPVYPNPDDLPATFDQTVALLAQNRFVVVFPEDPTRPLDPQFGMSPFKKGFVRLGELYFQRTGRRLKFYPLAVHATRRTVQVGEPVTYNPYVPPVKERIRVKAALENMIHEMLAERDGSAYLGVPLPH
jgi:1-acyl-sn-glycerol-3-phosphate acyltransferase